MLDPANRLTQIINTLDTELNVYKDPGQRAEIAREVATRGRLIEQIGTDQMRGAVQEMRAAGASHAEIGDRFGVSRGRAQQLAGIPVLLEGGPRDGQMIHPAPGKGGRPNRQLLVAVPHLPQPAAVTYWRRLEPELDGSWVAEFYPGTTAPPNWVEDL